MVEEKVKAYALHNSSVMDDEDYIQYTEWKEDGKLDADGYYNDGGEYAEEYADDQSANDGSADAGKEKKQVHVTFAQNSYLRVSYYYDQGLNNPIENDYCYLNSGETIYASQPECTNPNTNYEFCGYRIFEYDDTGKRNEFTTSEEGEVLTIPEDYQGTELSVEPIGEYKKYNVGLSAYMFDKEGNAISIKGKWEVNDKEYIEDAVTSYHYSIRSRRV